MNYREHAWDALLNKAKTDRSSALASLRIMLDYPAGIGDHSTTDLHNNLNEALSQLADADDRLETLKQYRGEIFDD